MTCGRNSPEEHVVIVSYAPKDGAVEEYSTDELSALESADIETVTGLEWDAVERALKLQNPTAMRAVMWAFHKRSNTQLRFPSFDVAGWKRRLKARFDSDEVLETVQQIHASKDVKDDAEFDEMITYLRQMACDPADVDRALDETGPKVQGGPVKQSKASAVKS
jgi:hypothetical protein